MGIRNRRSFSLHPLLLLALVSCTAPDAGNNSPPTAVFSLSPALGTAPQQVTVDGSSSVDPDGDIVEYAWNFGDGMSAVGMSAVHTFTAAGTFPVILTVTDDAGATASSIQSVFIGPSAGTE